MRFRLPGLKRFLRGPPEFSHIRSLQTARRLGFAPRVIYDIGAYHGSWSLATANVFPDARFVLFEANKENESALRNCGFPFFIVVLGAEEGAVKKLYLSRRQAATGVSLFRETTPHFAGSNAYTVDVTIRTLDEIAFEHRLDAPDLIKMDVQGSEIDVVAGAGKSLAASQMIIIEASLLRYNQDAPLIADVFNALNLLGFKCVDICEVHRIGPGLVFQADFVFVREKLYDRYRMAAGLL